MSPRQSPFWAPHLDKVLATWAPPTRSPFLALLSGMGYDAPTSKERP